jgi:hypothetical protein
MASSRHSRIALTQPVADIAPQLQCPLVGVGGGAEAVDHLQLARQGVVTGRERALALTATLDLQIAAGLNKQFRAGEALEVARVRAAHGTRHLVVGSLLGYAGAILAGRDGRRAEAEAAFAAADAADWVPVPM